MVELNSAELQEDINLLSAFTGITPENIIRHGFAYWLTELTDDEAKTIGAKAYLKRMEAEDAKVE